MFRIALRGSLLWALALVLTEVGSPQLASARRTPRPAAGYDPSVLLAVDTSAQAVRSAGSVPVVVFDLDETLIDSRGRALRILRDLVSMQGVRERYPDKSAALLRLTADDEVLEARALTLEAYALDLDDLLTELGAFDPALYKELAPSFVDLYLSDAYCGHDRPIPGAADYVREVALHGATVVYVTGRSRPGMALCTEESLRKNGFPLGAHAELIMKPRRDQDDREFKAEMAGTLARLGKVVAIFENEPANLAALGQAFPEATLVFLDTMHSKRPDAPPARAHWLRDFATRRAP